MIKRLQNGYKAHHNSIQARKKAYSKFIFPLVQSQIQSIMIRNKKSLKNPFFNNLEAKIMTINEKVKERVLDLYLAR